MKTILFSLLLIFSVGCFALPYCPHNKDKLWDNCIGSYTWEAGTYSNSIGMVTEDVKYTGGFKLDEIFGQGTIVFENGDSYSGFFTNYPNEFSNFKKWVKFELPQQNEKPPRSSFKESSSQNDIAIVSGKEKFKECEIKYIEMELKISEYKTKIYAMNKAAESATQQAQRNSFDIISGQISDAGKSAQGSIRRLFGQKTQAEALINEHANLLASKWKVECKEHARQISKKYKR